MCETASGTRRRSKLAFDADTDYYQILGVTSAATGQQLRQAYRSRMMAVHPDRHHGERRRTATDEARVLNQAFSVLSRPETRKAYDAARVANRVQEQIMGRYATGLSGAQDHYALLREEVARQRAPLRQRNDRSATLSVFMVFSVITVISIVAVLMWAVLGSVLASVK